MPARGVELLLPLAPYIGHATILRQGAGRSVSALRFWAAVPVPAGLRAIRKLRPLDVVELQ
jgi:hypothetical protein